MTVNPYINNYFYTETQNLISNIIQESIQFNGIDVKYITRNFETFDEFFGEQVEGIFDDAFTIEMYLNNSQFYGGEHFVLSKFGIEQRDSMELVVHQERFRDVTSLDSPREGDLIYFPFSKMLLEVNYVEKEENFYALGKNYIFKLQCTTKHYNNETFNVDSDVDDITDTYQNTGTTTNIPNADNDLIDDLGEEFVDFSVDNPFGNT